MHCIFHARRFEGASLRPKGRLPMNKGVLAQLTEHLGSFGIRHPARKCQGNPSPVGLNSLCEGLSSRARRQGSVKKRQLAGQPAPRLRLFEEFVPSWWRRRAPPVVHGTPFLPGFFEEKQLPLRVYGTLVGRNYENRRHMPGHGPRRAWAPASREPGSPRRASFRPQGKLSHPGLSLPSFP